MTTKNGMKKIKGFISKKYASYKKSKTPRAKALRSKQELQSLKKQLVREKAVLERQKVREQIKKTRSESFKRTTPGKAVSFIATKAGEYAREQQKTKKKQPQSQQSFLGGGGWSMPKETGGFGMGGSTPDLMNPWGKKKRRRR